MDPVRFLSNHSTGKMGYAVAARAALRGAETTLVSGPTALDTPAGVQRVDVVSACEMYDAVVSRAAEQDMIVKAAAVGITAPRAPRRKSSRRARGTDARVGAQSGHLAELGRKKRPGQLLCGFAMETQSQLENAAEKLRRKNCDMLVANSPARRGRGLRHGYQRRDAPVCGWAARTPPLMSKGSARGRDFGPAARDAAGAGVTARRGDGMRVPAWRISGA